MGRGSSDHNMIAPARADMLAIDHELVGAQATLTRLLIDRFGRGHAIIPAGSGMDIDLNDTRIRGHANDVETRVLRRGIAFKMDRLADFLGLADVVVASRGNLAGPLRSVRR